MKSTIQFVSRNKNCYLYDYNKDCFLLVHPLVHSILGDKAGCGIGGEDIAYYKKKICFLKQSGWFASYPFERRISRQLRENDIRIQLANTNQLTFEVTENCNLDCFYCGYGKLYNNYGVRGHRQLKLKTILPILDYCLELWNSDLNKSPMKKIYVGFYGGEPLLNIDFIKQVVEYIREKDVNGKVIFAMTTNATLLRHYINFLVDNNFELLISLDGNTLNNSYRTKRNRKESYEDVSENVDFVYRHYTEYFKKYVNFNAVLHNRNSVEDIYNHFSTKYNKVPQISELNTNSVTDDRKEDFERMFLNFEKSVLTSKKMKLLVDKLFISIPYFKDLTRFLFQYGNILRDINGYLKNKNSVYLPTGTCVPFSKKIYVTAHGLLYPCETISRDNPLGQVSVDKVSIDFGAIVEFYNRIYIFMKKKCSICYYQKSCVQCIYNMPVVDNKIECKTLMNESLFASYLSEKTSFLEVNISYYWRILNHVYLK